MLFYFYGFVLLLITSISVNKSLLYTQGIQTPMLNAHSNNEEIFKKNKIKKLASVSWIFKETNFLHYLKDILYIHS